MCVLIEDDHFLFTIYIVMDSSTTTFTSISLVCLYSSFSLYQNYRLQWDSPLILIQVYLFINLYVLLPLVACLFISNTILVGPLDEAFDQFLRLTPFLTFLLIVS